MSEPGDSGGVGGIPGRNPSFLKGQPEIRFVSLEFFLEFFRFVSLEFFATGRHLCQLGTPPRRGSDRIPRLTNQHGVCGVRFSFLTSTRRTIRHGR